MSAPVDAFVAGQYYCFYTQPDVSAAGAINTPGIDPRTGLNKYVVSNGAGGTQSAGTAGVPSWVGASARGFTISSSMSAELVEGDIWGGSVVEVIYRGGNMFMQWDAIAFKYGSVVPFWPWSTIGTVGTVGRLGSFYGGEVILSAAPGTTAANFPAIGQVSITALLAKNCILAENSQLELYFDSRLRRVPVRLRILPFFDLLYTHNTGGAGGLTGFAGYLNPSQVGRPSTESYQTVVSGSSTTPYSISSVAAYKWYDIL
jgi:hypothetical protein